MPSTKIPFLFCKWNSPRRGAIAKILGFINGAVCPVCRPQQNQRIIDNWHKSIHAIKFQLVVAQNRLTAMLDEPCEKRRPDTAECWQILDQRNKLYLDK